MFRCHGEEDIVHGIKCTLVWLLMLCDVIFWSYMCCREILLKYILTIHTYICKCHDLPMWWDVKGGKFFFSSYINGIFYCNKICGIWYTLLFYIHQKKFTWVFSMGFMSFLNVIPHYLVHKIRQEKKQFSLKTVKCFVKL